MDNLFDLTGRVAVVTGASSGLGADAARAYAGQGADVALLARRVEKLKTVADEIAATGRKVLVVGCDVTDEEQVRKAIGQVVALERSTFCSTMRVSPCRVLSSN